MGLTENEDPVKVESDLMELIPRTRTMFGHRIFFTGGRFVNAQAEVR